MARLLLAEDDDSMRHFLSRALESAGHEVAAVADGLEAWRLFQSLRGAGAEVDLLLADVVMPGLDGIELARRAGALQPGLRVLFITGFAAVAIRARDQRPQGSRVLSKPFHLRELVDQVEGILAG